MFHGVNNHEHTRHVPVPPPQLAQTPPKQHAPAAVASRAYKTCTNLFLTRRLAEALQGLQPVVAGPQSAISQCPRALRIKLWNLYLAILDAAAKMTPTEGKAMWGQQEWPALVAMIRGGEIWELVNRSYGDEGRVDAEVVISLATLLLSHAPDQSITQKRIEAYIGAMPNPLSQEEDPKSMMQRAKIVEIYILHVLPRVGEWAYAKEFAQMSPDIDEDQKEAFYATLEALQKDQEAAELHSKELERQRDEELEWERQQAEEAARPKSSPTRSRSSRRDGSVKPGGRASSARPRATSARPAAKEEIAPKPTAKRQSMSAKERPVVGARKAQAKVPREQSSLISSTTALLSRLQAHMATPSGPLSMLRTVLMLAMVAWMTSNKRVRERVRRLLIVCWIKLTRTIGMGMKVTYV